MFAVGVIAQRAWTSFTGIAHNIGLQIYMFYHL